MQSRRPPIRRQGAAKTLNRRLLQATGSPTRGGGRSPPRPIASSTPGGTGPKPAERGGPTRLLMGLAGGGAGAPAPPRGGGGVARSPPPHPVFWCPLWRRPPPRVAARACGLRHASAGITGVGWSAVEVGATSRHWRLAREALPPSLKETASTDSPSVQALVAEQALNKRDSVPVPFGRTDLNREISKETGGSAEGSGRDRLDYQPNQKRLSQKVCSPCMKDLAARFQITCADSLSC